MCSPSCSLTCTTCEAGLRRTTPRRLLSLINFKKTLRPDTAACTFNRRINAYFQASVNKRGEERWQGKERTTALRRDKKQSPYENNNAVTCKQGEKHKPPLSTPQPGQKEPLKRWDLPNFSLQEQSGNKAQEEKGETGREKENIMSSLEGDAVVWPAVPGRWMEAERCHGEAPASFTTTTRDKACQKRSRLK